MSDENEKIEIKPHLVDTLSNEDVDDIISIYVTPNKDCICCSIPKLSLKINKAYLDGATYSEIIARHADEAFKATNRKLNQDVLSEHFTRHFNFKGAAVAEYNRRYATKALTTKERKEMLTIFDVLKQEKVTDLEILDLAKQQQITLVDELEQIKQTRKDEGRTYNIDNLIMKQAALLDNINVSLLEKLKIWQKAQLQNKQMQLIDRHLQFLDGRTAEFLGIDLSKVVNNPAITKQAEGLYLKSVIMALTKRITETLDSALTLETHQKAEFYKELQRKFQGIEIEINEDFKKRMSELRDINKEPGK